MKTLVTLFASKRWFQRLSTYLAATATVGGLTLGTGSWLGRAHADEPRGHGNRELEELGEHLQKAQLFELNELEKTFHQAGSYGGDIEGMMALWADDATLTIASTGTVFSGKDAIRGFFTGAGPFTHYWVGLTPAFKFTADLHGHTAEIAFQCVFVNPAVTPAVVTGDSIFAGTLKKVHGKWLFWRMNSLPATLAP